MTSKMEEQEKPETAADVSWFSLKTSNSSQAKSSNKKGNDEPDRPMQPPPPDQEKVPFDKLGLYYDMTGQKLLIIFNHFKYESSKFFRYKKPSDRTGTDQDVIRLQKTFKDIGFQIDVHNDLTYSEIKNIMYKVSSKDHRSTSCVAVVILTHGVEGEVFARDRPYLLHDVINPMQNGDPGLVGKPKLFFVQACRGGHMDSGKRVETDGGRESIVLPSHSDTLVMRSTSEHYLSYRDCTGSWLMKSLCEVLDTHHQYYDLLQMLVLVNQSVAYKSTFTPDCEITANKKQMPETTHTMTKFLRFN